MTASSGGILVKDLNRTNTLVNRLDKNGDGRVTIDEVCNVIDEIVAQERQTAIFKRVAFVGVLISLLAVAATAGLTYAVVKGSKDTEITNGVLVAKGGDPVMLEAADMTVDADGVLVGRQETAGTVGTSSLLLEQTVESLVQSLQSATSYDEAQRLLTSVRQVVVPGPVAGAPYAIWQVAEAAVLYGGELLIKSAAGHNLTISANGTAAINNSGPGGRRRLLATWDGVTFSYQPLSLAGWVVIEHKIHGRFVGESCFSDVECIGYLSPGVGDPAAPVGAAQSQNNGQYGVVCVKTFDWKNPESTGICSRCVFPEFWNKGYYSNNGKCDRCTKPQPQCAPAFVHPNKCAYDGNYQYYAGCATGGCCAGNTGDPKNRLCKDSCNWKEECWKNCAPGKCTTFQNPLTCTECAFNHKFVLSVVETVYGLETTKVCAPCPECGGSTYMKAPCTEDKPTVCAPKVETGGACGTALNFQDDACTNYGVKTASSPWGDVCIRGRCRPCDFRELAMPADFWLTPEFAGYSISYKRAFWEMGLHSDSQGVCRRCTATQPQCLKNSEPRQHAGGRDISCAQDNTYQYYRACDECSASYLSCGAVSLVGNYVTSPQTGSLCRATCPPDEDFFDSVASAFTSIGDGIVDFGNDLKRIEDLVSVINNAGNFLVDIGDEIGNAMVAAWQVFGPLGEALFNLLKNCAFNVATGDLARGVESCKALIPCLDLRNDVVALATEFTFSTKFFESAKECGQVPPTVLSMRKCGKFASCAMKFAPKYGSTLNPTTKTETVARTTVTTINNKGV